MNNKLIIIKNISQLTKKVPIKNKDIQLFLAWIINQDFTTGLNDEGQKGN